MSGTCQRLIGVCWRLGGRKSPLALQVCAGLAGQGETTRAGVATHAKANRLKLVV